MICSSVNRDRFIVRLPRTDSTQTWRSFRGSGQGSRHVLDTLKREQSAAYHIDSHKGVVAFVKNAGLGFAVPYLHNGQTHDYEPDFIVRLEAAAERWCAAINAHGGYGKWVYRLATAPGLVPGIVNAALHL